MCNSYRVNQKKDKGSDLGAVVSRVAARLASSLVRKSDPGVVMRADGRVEIMRWGFQRTFNPSINNARSDKLGSGMWSEAYRNRRCVIPVTLFYEWGAGIGGRKQAHEFQAADEDYGHSYRKERRSLGDYSKKATPLTPTGEPTFSRLPW